MESFEQVSTQYTPMIYKIISSLHIYVNKDEFFQIGLIALWEAYERFEPEKGSFTNYAYSFIKGRLLTEIRQSHNHFENTCPVNEEFLDFIEDEFSTCPLEEDILLSYCQAADLTENQKKWILYTCLKELSVSEIAEMEQVSLSAVKSWRAGAKEKLQKARKENRLF